MNGSLLRLFVLVALLLPLLAGEQPGPAQSEATDVKVILSGRARSISPFFYGYNLDAGSAQQNWSDVGLLRQAAAMLPGTLRYPGGSLSNYWNWRRGWYGVPPYGKTGKFYTGSAHRFSLSDLKRMVAATGAMPIFDLNVMTASLTSQLDMLKRAARIGLDVRNIELGNEFYLSNTAYVRAFPSAENYAHRVATWLPALRRAFPKASIAAVGYAQTGRPSARERSWNQTMHQYAPNVSVLTMHVYYNPRHILGQAVNRTERVLTLPFAGWTQIQDASLKKLPAHVRVWVTEYNMQNAVWKNGRPTFLLPQRSWTNALFAGTMGLLFLQDSRIQLVDYHSLVSDVFGALESSGEPSPSGVVQQMIHAASRGMTRAQPLSFAGAPRLGTYPALIGWAFEGALSGPRAVLLNLSSQAVTLRLPQILADHMDRETVWGPPSAVTFDRLEVVRGPAGATITLMPYAALYLYPHASS